jgi:hypothetical protein
MRYPWGGPSCVCPWLWRCAVQRKRRSVAFSAVAPDKKRDLRPSREASLRNLEKAKVKWRSPRPWRSHQETQVIKRLAWQWFDSNGHGKSSGRSVARKLGVTHTYIQKLLREFLADPDTMRREQAAFGETTFAQLARAKDETRQQKERGRLRRPRLWEVAEFKIGGSVVSSRVPAEPSTAPPPPITETPVWAGGWAPPPHDVLIPPNPQLLSYFPPRQRRWWR